MDHERRRDSPVSASRRSQLTSARTCRVGHAGRNSKTAVPTLDALDSDGTKYAVCPVTCRAAGTLEQLRRLVEAVLRKNRPTGVARGSARILNRGPSNLIRALEL